MDLAEEHASLLRVLNAFDGYQETVEQEIRRWEHTYNDLPETHKKTDLDSSRNCCHICQKSIHTLECKCLAKNVAFITAMLEAFEPPIVSREPISEEECFIPKGLGDNQAETSDNPSGNVTSGDALHSQRVKHAKTSGEYEGSVPSASQVPSSTRSSVSEIPKKYRGWFQPSPGYRVPPQDSEKVQCMLRSFVRDWSEEGASERQQCYSPILRELTRMFPKLSQPFKAPISCLVPGAGHGRLALEIACLGFLCQANDFSFYTLLCSDFVLNHMARAEQWTIHPWLTASSNSIRDEDQLRPVRIPDMLPGETSLAQGFSMCAGDFVQVYSHPSQRGIWDSVVTCFFLDTAPNVVRYIEVISHLLRRGGVWINLGPLLYHFAVPVPGQPDQASLELSLEDVKRVALQMGFRVEREEMREACYTANGRSMMHTQYLCAFWTMVKEGEIKREPN